MHSIDERKLIQWITDEIEKYAQLANNQPSKLIEDIKNNKNLVTQRKMNSFEKKHQMLIDEIKYLDDVFHQLFEDRMSKIITEETYTNLAAKYDERLQKATNEKKKVENLLRANKEQVDNIIGWIEKIKQYQNASELTRDMLMELIDHIDVYEKSACESKRNIEVVWKY